MKLKQNEWELSEEEKKELREFSKLVRESPSSGIWDGWEDTEAKSAKSYFRFSRGRQK